MKSRFFTLLLALVTGATLRADTPPVPAPVAQIYFADIDRTQEKDGPRNTVKRLQPSPLKIINAVVTPGMEGAGRLRVSLTIDDFAPEIGGKLVVKLGDEVFVPYSYGGDKDRYWSLELRDITPETAALLSGQTLRRAPREWFQVEFLPLQKSFKAGETVRVGLWIRNVSDKTLTYYYGTDGGGNGRARDLQLSISATRGGQNVASAKPLPPGFISHPLTAKPQHTLKRWAELSDYFAFDQPGEYQIEARYRLLLQNPDAASQPREWEIEYSDRFAIHIEKPGEVPN